jgi:hypothetical protein
MAGASLAESQTRIQSITLSMAFRPAPTKHLFHSLLLPVGLGVLVLVAGCRREPTPAPAPAAPAEVPGPALAPPQPGQAPPPVVSTIESKDTAYTQEMVQTLNDFLGDYIKQHKRVPRDIAEMVNLKIITSVPVLPGGKKWVINQQTGKISAQ